MARRMLCWILYLLTCLIIVQGLVIKDPFEYGKQNDKDVELQSVISEQNINTQSVLTPEQRRSESSPAQALYEAMPHQFVRSKILEMRSSGRRRSSSVPVSSEVNPKILLKIPELQTVVMRTVASQWTAMGHTPACTPSEQARCDPGILLDIYPHRKVNGLPWDSLLSIAPRGHAQGHPIVDNDVTTDYKDFTVTLRSLCQKYDIYKACVNDCYEDEKYMVMLFYGYLCDTAYQDLMKTTGGPCLVGLTTDYIINSMKAKAQCQDMFMDMRSPLLSMTSILLSGKPDRKKATDRKYIKDLLSNLCTTWRSIEDCVIPAVRRSDCGEVGANFYVGLLDAVKKSNIIGYGLQADCPSGAAPTPIHTHTKQQGQGQRDGEKHGEGEGDDQFGLQQAVLWKRAEDKSSKEQGICSARTYMFRMLWCFWRAVGKTDLLTHIRDIMKTGKQMCQGGVIFQYHQCCSKGNNDESTVSDFSKCPPSHQLNMTETFNSFCKFAHYIDVNRQCASQALRAIAMVTTHSCGMTLPDIFEHMFFRANALYEMSELPCKQRSHLNVSSQIICMDESFESLRDGLLHKHILDMKCGPQVLDSIVNTLRSIADLVENQVTVFFDAVFGFNCPTRR